MVRFMSKHKTKNSIIQQKYVFIIRILFSACYLSRIYHDHFYLRLYINLDGRNTLRIIIANIYAILQRKET